MSFGLQKIEAVYATLLIGIEGLVMTLLCAIIIEKSGRRSLLLVGFSGLALSLLLLAFSPVLIVRIF
jgi:hypothetical protein